LKEKGGSHSLGGNWGGWWHCWWCWVMLVALSVAVEGGGRNTSYAGRLAHGEMKKRSGLFFCFGVK